MLYENRSPVAYDQSETFDVICDLRKMSGRLGDDNLLLHRMKSYIDREVRCNYNVHTLTTSTLTAIVHYALVRVV